ncbi:ribosome maturation factor RimM [Desulfotruncus alcoholivorax]|uniref:ribosome maturation factor RimM n=1 Tax=Desulfotruncus alcoholivorax TaxID=265477 RepID=UPI0003F75304|nr:ribosome maturation factor RimM [Desulfotruncus alcoholivorax]
MAQEIEGYIAIGKIINTQGHRGELRVIPTTDFPERFKNMKRVYVNRNGQLAVLDVERSYPHKKFFVLKFSGIDDMNSAETLKGSYLLISKEELMPLPEDTFYIFDIIGLKVFTTDGRYLGMVTDVQQTGANDIYLINRESKMPLMVPALKQVVHEVDLAAGRMIVELPAGLED